MINYSKRLIGLINKADKANKINTQKVSDLMCDCIINDGIIYMFGCGHSSLIASDCFYRAGGLANVQPVFVEKLMLHKSASESSKLEKNEENAYGVLDGYVFGEHDLMFVFSVSGINGVPVQIALDAKNKGLTVVGVGSSEYFSKESRHSSGKRLIDVSDVFLDNCVPIGDAVMDYGCMRAVPVSTALSSCLVQQCISVAIDKSIKAEHIPYVFGSGNLNENLKNNNDLLDKFDSRIRFL